MPPKASDIPFAILGAREERGRHTRRFIMRLRRPTIVLSVNVPGPDKNEPWVAGVLRRGRRAVGAELEACGWIVQEAEAYDSAAGPEWRAAIAGTEDIERGANRCAEVRSIPSGIELKRMAVRIEETHPIGRLLDIDVFDRDRTPIGRSALGLPPRRCLVCGNAAHECARSRRHAPSELRARIAALLG